MPQPFVRLTAPLAPLPLDNVDTDQICPAVAHQGLSPRYGDFLFRTQRQDGAGRPVPGFVLNDPAYAGAGILLAGRNFGCGSGRETAVWALAGAGFRCVVALGFADLFRGNCLRNGLLPLALPADSHADLLARALAAAGAAPFTVDLERQVIVCPQGPDIAFAFPEAERQALLAGLDEIGVTLEMSAAIAAWEARTALRRPWLQRVPDEVGAGGAAGVPPAPDRRQGEG